MFVVTRETGVGVGVASFGLLDARVILESSVGRPGEAASQRAAIS
jgi:hypothetical protein